MPILQLKPPPDFSARALLNVADQVMEQHSKYAPIDTSDVPLLIMKGILRWEEIKAEYPEYGVLKENESKEPEPSPESNKSNQ